MSPALQRQPTSCVLPPLSTAARTKKGQGPMHAMLNSSRWDNFSSPMSSPRPTELCMKVNSLLQHKK